MGPEISIIEPEARDSFGQYMIQSGRTMVFPFTIPLLGSVEIISQHTRPESQDFSLDLWISSEPLDDLLLEEGFGHLKLNREETTHVLYDEFLRSGDEDSRLFLPSGRPLFLNLKNLQNSPNTFLLEILEQSA